MFIVDSREARTNAHVVKQLEEIVGVRRELLAYGDFVVEGPNQRVGIEVATVNDVVGKIQSGRFQQQLVGCIESYEVVVLLICGHIEENVKGYIHMHGHFSKMPFRLVRGAIFAAKAHGIIVEEVNTVPTTIARRLLDIHSYYTKDEHTLFRGLEKRPHTLATGQPIAAPVLALMSLVDGIGETKARTAIEYMGNLQELVVADDEELLEIPGWGPTTVYRLHKALDRQF